MNYKKNKNQIQSNNKESNRLNTYARFSGIAFQMLAIIGIGSFVGVKLDKKYPNKNNIYTIILSLSSVILAIIYVVKRIIADSKDN